jgi:hypothetical protein
MKTTLTIFAFPLFLLAACSKSSDPAPTTTTTTTTKTVEELLTQRTWKTDEIRSQLSNNTTQYYKRGGSSNTVNYDSDSLKFNVNNTGTYYFGGVATSTTWNFINSEKSKMTIIINYSPTPLTINWEYVNVAETTLKYTQYVTGGISYLASGTRVPN